jgi:hypothetical protein
MRLLTLLLLVGIAVVRTCAQSAPPLDSKVALQVSIATNQTEFHIGETIPLQLSFSSTVKDHYQVNMAQYDRSGRMNYEHFDLAPANGVVDPLPTYTGSMGGLTNFKYLTPEPWSIKLNLNEWVRFTQPGEYRIAVSSRRVGVRDPSQTFGTSSITVRSNEVELKIVPANPEWQKGVLRDAVASLDAPAPAKRQQTEQYAASRRQALATLRFLGTGDAARELAKRMRGEDSGGLDYICMLGLISSPERSAARSALAEALADPDHPIDSNFLYALRVINAEPNVPDTNWRETQQRVVEELVAVLPAKRGKALSISLSTAVNEVWNGTPVVQKTQEKLVSQLISMFDQLPVNEQNSLLSYRWDRIGSRAMLPILKRYAQTYHDFPEMRDANAYASLQVSASALRHWYELDPAGARPAIIAEITRPRPRYDARVLGLLPDETLPEVDFALAEHLTASNDLDASAHLASLIARYATAAILPQVTEKLDPRIGKWACAVQNPILAYILRVSPVSARPRIEQAIAARGEGFSACNHGLFQEISQIHYDPLIEELGIKALDDLDPEVAMTAATMLGKFGSPDAESALWRRYASWSAQWVGRESQLDLTLGEGRNDKADQLGLGENLVQALATGKSWLSDRAKLQRLSELSKVKRIHQQQLDRYLKMWEEPVISISFEHNPEPYPFHAHVAQYEFQSLVALKDKLAQFPSGTKFYLSRPPVDSPDNDQTLSELRTFLSSHGMSVAEKRAN